MARGQRYNQFGRRWRLCPIAAFAVAAIGLPALAQEFVGPPFEPTPQPEAPQSVITSEGPASNLPVDISPVEIPAPDQAVSAAPAPVVSATESLPLRSPRDAVGVAAARRDPSAPDSGSGWWMQTTGALVLVIGLILIIKWGGQRLARRSGSVAWQLGPAGRAPSGVLEVLGRYPVSRGHSLVLLKLDRRVLLLGQSASGFSTLTQVTDPEEVASLLVKTRDEEGASNAARFTEMLHQMERDPTIVGETNEIEMGEPATGARLPRIGLRGVTA